MSTSKSSWFTNIAGLWRSFISQMDRKSVGNKCPVPWSVSGVVTHGWGLGRRSRSRDGWHVLPALPGNQSVCPGEEEGKEDIQVSWLPAVTGAAGVLSCDSNSRCHLSWKSSKRTGVGTDKSKGRNHQGIIIRMKMEAGGAWGHLQQLNVHFPPENFSLSRKESTIYCRKRSFRGKPDTECVISLLLSQWCVTAWGPSHPAPFHCSIFVNGQKGHLMHTLCYPNRKEPKKISPRSKIIFTINSVLPPKGTV